MRVLVTGAAGFVGFHLRRRLLAEGITVVGFDGMTTYYDVELKQARCAEVGAPPRFRGRSRCSRMSPRSMACADAKPDVVVHLAAQAASATASKSRAPMWTPTWSAHSTSWKSRARSSALPDGLDQFGLRRQPAMPFRETDRTDHR